MKSFFLFIWDVSKILIIALIIVIPIRYFLFQPFFVKGESMEPNFYNYDYLIVDEISYQFRDPKRGEIIVFKYPHDTSQRYIKRIIGLPGETIEIKDNCITIESKGILTTLDESAYLESSINTKGDIKIVLPEEKYFVLGDNRRFSYDSRQWGLLPKENIIGKVLFRAYPLSALVRFTTPSYQN
ncbi:MAG: signal peptidase I [Patescibacteria group bacterium]|nr:signal peptidase I [Patescibacteria group bacterium]